MSKRSLPLSIATIAATRNAASQRDDNATLQREDVEASMVQTIEVTTLQHIAPEQPVTTLQGEDVAESIDVVRVLPGEVDTPERPDRASAMEGNPFVEQGPDDVEEVPTRPGRAKKLLPHASIYLHADVHYALKLHAIQRRLRLQDVLRQAVAEYMARQGFPMNLETGKRLKK